MTNGPSVIALIWSNTGSMEMLRRVLDGLNRKFTRVLSTAPVSVLAG